MKDYAEIMSGLLARDEVKRILDYIETHDAETLAAQLELVEIRSPSNHEEKRAKRFFEMMSEAGLDKVYMDEVNNVIGILRGTGEGPTLILSGHMDTVFGPEVDCRPVIKEDGWIWAPGICDDTRGMAEVLTVAKAFCAEGIRTKGDVWFVGNVGEESLGDLRGTRQLFRDHGDEIGALVSIDGTTPGGVTITAVGGRKLKFTFKGRGGHALGAFGIPNCNNAMGRAIAKIADIEVPKSPKTIFNVGIVNGGVSVNAIPSESTMLVDMRSVGREELDALVAKVRAAVQEGLKEELARWNHPTETLTVEESLLSARPGGTQTPEDPIAAAAKAANDCFGMETHFGSASTDCNIPISLGIPAVALGRGGTQIDGHAVTERFHPEGAFKGPQRAALLVLALCGLEGCCEPILAKRGK